jgi:hypothetical protein
MKLFGFGFRGVSVFLLVTLISSVSAYAQNLLANPEFDSDLSGWTGPQAGVFDPTLNAPGSTGGSAQSINDQDNPGCPPGAVCVGQVAIRQCVPVTAGTAYDFGGKLFIPGAQAASGYGNVALGFWASASCAGGFISVSESPDVLTVDVWGLSIRTVEAPPGAVSASVLGANNRTTPSGSFKVNFDSMFFQPTLITQVQNLVVAGTLTSEQAAGLLDKVNEVLRKITSGKIHAACNQLNAFKKQVIAFVNSGALTVEQGQSLIDAATIYQEAVGCG